jgi:ABC-type Zn uptake system ZnuABC Zn-binding protein ZnuA
MIKRLGLLLTFIMITASACSPLASNADLKTGPAILATTTFLADIAQNVAGERATVESLLPVGADPHGYQTTPADMAKVSKSAVLIQNGIEYESFIKSLLQNIGGKRLVITASDGLTTRNMTENGSLIGDPHMWLDPTRVVKYVENIRDGLSQADPASAKIYQANADAYIAKLKTLDAWIVEQVNQIPAARRLLVTNHEALGYFADRYGFKIVGTIIPSLSTDAGTSAQGLANVIDQIKATGAPAIFLGDVENPALADQIASETGVKVISNLHLESLTDGAPAATYIDMMRYNVSAIVEALK